MAIEAFLHLSEEKKQNILINGIREFAQNSYAEVSTDTITRKCGISKGILFHYFGSKKEFYRYCLQHSMSQLVTDVHIEEHEGFYGILFNSMAVRFRLCLDHPDEMHMVNMAVRETAGDLTQLKEQILTEYRSRISAGSMTVLRQALSTLSLKEPDNPKILDALMVYTNAIMNRYLTIYLETPDQFFNDEEIIQNEMKEYIDFFLKGVLQ